MSNNLYEFFYSFLLPLFSYLSDFGKMILEFFSRDFLGYPLIYWVFGAGLTVFLYVRIAKALV